MTGTEIWRELLAVDSPLVQQPWDLQDALLRTDASRKTQEIRKLCRDMSAEAQHVLAGLAMYHRHMEQLAHADMDAAMASAEEGLELLGENLFGDVRRLGDVLKGLSRGWLYEDAYTGASDLLVDVLEVNHAYALMDRIVSRKPGWRYRLKDWVSTKLLAWYRKAALARDPDRKIPFNPDGLGRRPLD